MMHDTDGTPLLDAHTAAHALETTTADLACLRRLHLIVGTLRGDRGLWFYRLDEVRRVAALIAASKV